MSESMIKLIGLATMILSVFVVLFGAHAGEAGVPEPWGMVAVVAGLLALLVGLVLYAVIKRD